MADVVDVFFFFLLLTGVANEAGNMEGGGRIGGEEVRVFEKREAEFRMLGVGVSAGAQAIFDVLNKTLPCRWERNVIVILDSVHLGPPYDAKSIRYVDDACEDMRVFE